MLMDALHFRFNMNNQAEEWVWLTFAVRIKREIEEIHGISISNAIND